MAERCVVRFRQANDRARRGKGGKGQAEAEFGAFLWGRFRVLGRFVVQYGEEMVRSNGEDDCQDSDRR